MDYRVEPESFDISRPVLYELVRNLSEPTVHVHDIRLLGFQHIVIGIKSKPLWRRLIDILRVRDLSQSGVPHPRFINALGFFLGSIVHINYVVHESIFKEVFYDIDEWAKKFERENSLIYMFTGNSLPVMNCSGMIGFNKDIVEASLSVFKSILGKSKYESRMPLVDYILIAALDLFPKLTLKQLRSIIYAARARLERKIDDNIGGYLKSRFVHRHYKAMSAHGVIGRIWAPREIHGDCFERIAFLAKGECLEQVYIAASSLLSSANIITSRDYVIASMGVPPLYKSRVLSSISDCIIIPLISYRVKVFPLPFEFYDPIKRVWSTKLVGYDLYAILKKFRLIEESSRGTS